MRHQNRFLIAIAVVVLRATPGAQAAGAMDSAFLGTFGASPSPSARPPVNKPLKPGGLKGLRAGPGAMEGSSAKSLDTVRSLTQLLKVTPAGVQRTNLILNRAAAINQYVRLTLLGSNRLKPDENERKWLIAAVRDATEALSAKEKEKDTLLRAHSILGISKLYLDESREAREHFLQVLRINPAAENAGWIGLLLAEDLFDDGRFADAIKFYRGYYHKMSAQQKEQALYKLAWCHINLSEERRAEELFIYLIKANAGSGISKDSTRDLAYLITHRKDPAAAISATEAIFKRPEDRIEFLSHVRANLEAQESVELHGQVVESLLKYEMEADRKLELLLANLRVTRKLYASRQHMSAFLKLSGFMSQAKLEPKSQDFLKVEPVVENELRFLMKAFIDTVAQRAKSPENPSREELGVAMKSQFEFFNHYFPGSKLRPSTVSLWIDVCVDLKDWPCVERATEVVLTERSLFVAHVERAYIDQLAALEELLKAAKPDQKAAVAAKRSQRMKEFITGFEKSSQWLRVARLYAELLGETGNSVDTIALLDRIYVREPTPDAFYRLQWARYKASDFNGVLGDPRNNSFTRPEQRLVELWREASLSLAVNSRKSDDAEGYRRHIRRFLQLNPEAKKAEVARLDYFQFLIGKENFTELSAELLALPPAMRHSVAFVLVLQNAWQRDIEQGRFKEALSLVASEPGSEGAYHRCVSQMIMGETPPTAEILALGTAQREYVLGLLAIARPRAALDHLERYLPRTPQEKDIAALALRLRSGSWDILRSSVNEKLLGKGFAFKVLPVLSPLPSESRLARLQFPTPKMKPKVMAKVIQDLVAQTRRIRQDLPQEMAGKPLELQLRAIEAARDLEKRVAQAIVESPPPPELDITKYEEYKEAVKGVAKEFEDQSSEFEQVAATIRDKIATAKAKADERLIPAPPPGEWKWPSELESDPALQLVSKAVQVGNYLGAHALIDFLRVTRLRSDESYFRARAGLILLASPREAHRIYLLSELEANKQESLVSEWRKLAHVGNGETGR